MKILVTGANGQLGNHMRMQGGQSPHEFFYTDVDELDITNRDAVFTFVEEHNIDVVVNCAAYTNVDKAEDDEEMAYRLNCIAVSYLAEAMKCCGGLLIHVSTDYVFGGNLYNVPIQEEEKPNPTGVYGRTKLQGEEAILSAGCRYVILRTAWLYSEYGGNFLKTMLRLLPEKERLTVVFDQVGTPTYAGDLASAIITIINNDNIIITDGIYHFSNEGVCSWFDFTKEIARQTGLTACKVQPCHSGEFPSKVVRPNYSVLDKTKIKKTFNIDIPYWTESLAVCLKNMNQK